MTRRFILFLFAATLAAQADPHWDVQFEYKQDDAVLTINDFAMLPSANGVAQRGIACGYATDHRNKQRPLVLLTIDGGAHWTETAVHETGLSLFFLDDTTGWMVTATGVWQTSEAGRNWTRKVKAPGGLTRVWFLDRRRGYGIGSERRIFETIDGGDSWILLPGVKEVESDQRTTTFGEIAFTGKAGIIAGWSTPVRSTPPVTAATGSGGTKSEPPRQTPAYSVMLQTVDAGQTWKKSDASLFGQITRISMAPQGTALGLIEFRDRFDYPSEVYSIDLHTGKSERAFRAMDRAITDVRLFRGLSTGVIAGYETPGPADRTGGAGSLSRVLVPGKLKVLISEDLAHWDEMTVDAHAVARRAMISGPDPDHLWIATDTGMILRLVLE